MLLVGSFAEGVYCALASHIMEHKPLADGGAGNGYSITPFGHIWLKEGGQDDFVPTEPERFGEILEKYK
ncbi:MAG: hypothetical protein COS67_08910 [Deltaproteobacteria bacterium CG06_land_8_20_14_3_00_44_19]|nr:MAG: hypothetical protein COS67_08910 [Deltaproteobacteria bacterium CG06_land_8_20_14_3_00_44_19]